MAGRAVATEGYLSDAPTGPGVHKSGRSSHLLPQLEEELQAEDLALRVPSDAGAAPLDSNYVAHRSQTLGEMYATDTALMGQHLSTFQVWLKHKNDKPPQVQLKFVEATWDLLSLPAAELRDAVGNSLGAKLMDPDDKVRAAVCRVYRGLDYETARHHAKTDQLRAVAGRGVDKKHSVRVEALHALRKLYSLAYPEIENKDSAAILHFTWIPHELFQMIKMSKDHLLSSRLQLGESQQKKNSRSPTLYIEKGDFACLLKIPLLSQ